MDQQINNAEVPKPKKPQADTPYIPISRFPDDPDLPGLI